MNITVTKDMYFCIMKTVNDRKGCNYKPYIELGQIIQWGKEKEEIYIPLYIKLLIIPQYTFSM